MTGTYLKISLRSILRNKVQSAISILGMGIGFGCVILLLALIIHEKSFNRYIPDHENIYRVVFGNATQTQYPLGEAMKNDFPEVKDFFRFYQVNNLQLRNYKGELLRDRNLAFADNSMFGIMHVRFIKGGPAMAFNEIAISEATADKYFGKVSPLGSIISIKFNNEFNDLVISGVYEDFPATSVLNPFFIADIRLSEKIFGQFQRSLGAYGNEQVSRLDWDDNEFLTVAVLEKNSDSDALALKMEKYKEHFMNDRVRDLKYRLQPVTDIYLGSQDISGVPFIRTTNEEDLKYYEAVSVLVLLISVLNYILLTRASAADRLKELGTRKAFGATRGILRKQIIIESNLVALASLIPASFVIDYGMDFINSVLNKTMSNDVFRNPVMLLLLAFVIIFTGTFSGILIGHRFSGIPALTLLSGKLSAGRKRDKWGYSFLMFHFGIYILLVAGVLSLTKQIRYSMTGFTGINHENVIVSYLGTDELRKNFEAISDELEKLPGVSGTAGGSYIPPFGNFLPVTLATPEGEKVRFDGLIMGEGLTELLGMEIVEGESFGPYSSDRISVLVNQAAAKEHNLKAGELFLGFSIRGIVKDFNAHSLHTAIQPIVILQQNPSRMGLIAVKTDGTNDERIIGEMRRLFTMYSPEEIFETRYLSDDVRDFYSRERNQSTIIGAFSILATVLSMMGLFGIALITISKKTKEVGIRKVNGATPQQILYLLNSGFLGWVIASSFIAIPAAVYFTSKWLERFAYKTELSWWIYALAVLSALLIAIITVSWQSLRAATRNPIEALRYE